MGLLGQLAKLSSVTPFAAEHAFGERGTMAVHCRAARALVSKGRNKYFLQPCFGQSALKEEETSVVFLLNCHTKKGLPCVWNERQHIPSRHQTSPCNKHKVNAALVLKAADNSFSWRPLKKKCCCSLAGMLLLCLSDLSPQYVLRHPQHHRRTQRLPNSTLGQALLKQVLPRRCGCTDAKPLSMPRRDMKAPAVFTLQRVLPSPSHTHLKNSAPIQPSAKART